MNQIVETKIYGLRPFPPSEKSFDRWLDHYQVRVLGIQKPENPNSGHPIWKFAYQFGSRVLDVRLPAPKDSQVQDLIKILHNYLKLLFQTYSWSGINDVLYSQTTNGGKIR